MVRKFTDKELLARAEALPTFKGFPESLWIIGVRSTADLPDEFDDKFYIYEGKKFVMMGTGTTHPAASILRGGFQSYNPLGAAIVKSDMWHHDIWKYGKHKGKMDALVQVGAPITIYRDGDKDLKSEETGKEMSGYYGINFHANTYDMENTTIKQKILGWSAGCQVVNDTPKYVEMMKLFSGQKSKKVSYCLLKEF